MAAGGSPGFGAELGNRTLTHAAWQTQHDDAAYEREVLELNA